MWRRHGVGDDRHGLLGLLDGARDTFQSNHFAEDVVHPVCSVTDGENVRITRAGRSVDDDPGTAVDSGLAGKRVVRYRTDPDKNDVTKDLGAVAEEDTVDASRRAGDLANLCFRDDVAAAGAMERRQCCRQVRACDACQDPVFSFDDGDGAPARAGGRCYLQSDVPAADDDDRRFGSDGVPQSDGVGENAQGEHPVEVTSGNSERAR